MREPAASGPLGGWGTGLLGAMAFTGLTLAGCNATEPSATIRWAPAASSWAGRVAAEPDYAVRWLARSPGWSAWAKGDLHQAFAAFGETPQAMPERIGRARAALALATEYAVLAQVLHQTAVERLRREAETADARALTTRLSACGASGDSPRLEACARSTLMTAAATFISDPARVCRSLPPLASEGVMACLAANDIERLDARLAGLDWNALARPLQLRLSDTETASFVNPLVPSAIAAMYRAAAIKAVCQPEQDADSPGAMLCRRAGQKAHQPGDTTAGSTNRTSDIANHFALHVFGATITARSDARATATSMAFEQRRMCLWLGEAVGPTCPGPLPRPESLRTALDDRRSALHAWISGLSPGARDILVVERLADVDRLGLLLDAAEFARRAGRLERAQRLLLLDDSRRRLALNHPTARRRDLLQIRIAVEARSPTLMSDPIHRLAERHSRWAVAVDALRGLALSHAAPLDTHPTRRE